MSDRSSVKTSVYPSYCSLKVAYKSLSKVSCSKDVCYLVSSTCMLDICPGIASCFILIFFFFGTNYPLPFGKEALSLCMAMFAFSEGCIYFKISLFSYMISFAASCLSILSSYSLSPAFSSVASAISSSLSLASESCCL